MKYNHWGKFFKVYPSGYGAGDSFIGVTVPIQKKKQYYKQITLGK